MTKQEAIQAAYGDYWGEVSEVVDKDGWIDERNAYNIEGFIGDCIKMESKLSPDDIRINLYRPISLHNIENNNGWIPINNKGDLPGSPGRYWFFSFGTIVCMSYEWGMFPNLHEAVSHYQLAVPPPPPIY